MKRIKIQYKKVAFALSLCMLTLWGILGTGTSLAWFTDTSTELKNIFHMADFDLKVYHRLPNGDYKEIEQDTAVFDDNALYEPGYVQVVYLKAENAGTVPFDCQMAVSVENYTTAINVYHEEFKLQDYLKFGVVVADTETELEAKVKNRTLAKTEAVMPLGFYESDIFALEAYSAESDVDTAYIAIVVYMPEEVGNEANYRGDVVPQVSLGIIVKASQQKTQ